jgi:signal transduction histidine kinase
MIPAIVDEHRHLSNGKSVALSFTHENPLQVCGPPSVVTIVIGNLLRNAIAHTERGTILIRLRDRTVSIQDSGKGIPAEALAQEFDRHFSTDSGGSGIGLYLVKTICDRYGWKVDLRSTLGKGTTVVLSFES